MNVEYFINLAIIESRKSEGDTQIGCVITDKKGRILSRGYNKIKKSHPVQAKYASDTNLPEKIFLHAEIDALIKLKEPPHTIYVGRRNKNGEYAIAKPCSICSAAIKDTPIMRVVYTINGSIEDYYI